MKCLKYFSYTQKLLLLGVIFSYCVSLSLCDNSVKITDVEVNPPGDRGEDKKPGNPTQLSNNNINSNKNNNTSNNGGDVKQNVDKKNSESKDLAVEGQKSEKNEVKSDVNSNKGDNKEVKSDDKNSNNDKNEVKSGKKGDKVSVNPTVSDPSNEIIRDHIPSLDSGAVKRAFYVFIGLSVIGVAYIMFRSTRLRKGPAQMVRKYGILAHKQDIEMRPLPLDEDDEDDQVVFDASGLSKHSQQASQSS